MAPIEGTAHKGSLRLDGENVSSAFSPSLSGGIFMGLARVHRQFPCPVEAVRVFQVIEEGHSGGNTPPPLCRSQ